MKILLGKIALVLCLWGSGLMLDRAFAQEIREWTDLEGRKVRAALVGVQDGETVVLRLEDGRTVPYPLGKLSARDGEYVRERSDQGGDGKSAVDWANPKQSPAFVIRGVRRQNVPGFISTKTGWEYRIKCIEVKLEYKGEEDGVAPTVRAYFYNRSGQLIDQFDEPPRRQDETRKYVTMPSFFRRGETVEIYYPITAFHESSAMSTVLIAFGAGDECSVETSPKTSLEHLAFVEKERLFPDWKPDAGEDKGASNTKGEMVEGSLEIRRLSEENYQYSIVFDGGYRKGVPCLSAEVRAKGKVAAPGQGTVKLYVFDERKQRVAFRARPSTANIGDGTYLGIPQIAGENWHPVCFALDGDLKGKKYPTYLLVFQFAGKTAVAVKSSVGETAESLDFPEKAELEGN